MPKFKRGDTVLVNGHAEVIQSWPDDDNGFFVTTYTDNGQSEVQSTHHTGTLDVVTDPVHTSANVQIVEPGDGVEHSTLGDIHDALTEIDETIEADLNKTNPVQ